MKPLSFSFLFLCALSACVGRHLIGDTGPNPPDASTPDSSTSSKVCGGLANLPCPSGYWCDVPPGANGQCGFFDQTGTCVPTGTGCIAVSIPVCGCDGKNYGNDCERQNASAQLAHKGLCSAPRRCGYSSCMCDPGQICQSGICVAVAKTCRSNDECAANQYCAFADGECLLNCDTKGTCQPRPTGCPKNMMTVCGCDGMDYGNSCFAAMAGASVEKQGRCAAPLADCSMLNEAECHTRSDCAAGYDRSCDCDCLGADYYLGCANCPKSCFPFAGCKKL